MGEVQAADEPQHMVSEAGGEGGESMIVHECVMIENSYEKRRTYFLRRKKECEDVGDLVASASFAAAADEPFCFLMPGDPEYDLRETSR